VPRRCTICDHVERHAINVALVQRDSYRHIASYYDVSTRALQRHSQKHLPKLLVEASRGVEVANADDLLAKVEELRRKKRTIIVSCLPRLTGRLSNSNCWPSSSGRSPTLRR
jgi:hypothetical protein